MGIKHEIALSLSLIALTLCIYKFELDLALKYAERSLVLAKESSKKYHIAVSLLSMAMVYSVQGKLDRSSTKRSKNVERPLPRDFKSNK